MLAFHLALPCCSLDNNQICGVNQFGRGTFTLEGINALCEGLKQSSITSLRYFPYIANG